MKAYENAYKDYLAAQKADKLRKGVKPPDVRDFKITKGSSFPTVNYWSD